MRPAHLFAAAMLVATSAFPTVQRTFVSAAAGSDTNACSRVSPCRNFAAAMAATSASGEVIVLDSGGYGTVAITQPVAIIAPDGVYAGVSVFTGSGLTVGSASGRVLLRGLTVNGLGGTTGIFINGGDVALEKCSTSNFSLAGFQVQSHGTLLIRACSAFANNTSFLLAGDGMGGVLNATVVDSQATSSMHGFVLANDTHATINKSLAAHNAVEGFDVCCSNSRLQMTWCETLNNGSYGVRAEGPNADVFIGWSTVVGNGTGLSFASPANIYTLGNNVVSGNTAATSGAIGSAPPN